MLGDGVGHDFVHVDADALWGLGGIHAEVNGIAPAAGGFYRRGERRARSLEINAPAPPTSARMTVGFSGESTQPVWA
jgi:hypothetical protein